MCQVCLFISRPPGAQVYWAPVRATVHESSKAAAPAGFNQREAGSNAVGMWGQLKRCIVLCSAIRHKGQVGEG